jgi:hypothetical protein
MKKVIAVVVLLTLVAGGVWAFTRTPERRLCQKMGKLCRVEGNYRDYDACVDTVEDLAATFGEEPVAQAADCVDDAQTCAEGIGCVAGVSASVVEGMIGDFKKGFDRSHK